MIDITIIDMTHHRLAVAIVASLLMVATFTRPGRAQSQAFEAISIKPARSSDPRDMRMRVLPNGDFSASAVSVFALLIYAYDVPRNPSPRLSGFAGWRETYDIEAKAPANAIPAGLPEREKRSRMQRHDARVARRSFQARDARRAEDNARLRSHRRKRRSESPEVGHRGEGLHLRHEHPGQLPSLHHGGWATP